MKACFTWRHAGDDVPPLVLREERVALAFELADRRVAADADVEVAQRGALLEEGDVAGVEPVVAAGDEDFLRRGGWMELEERVGVAGHAWARSPGLGSGGSIDDSTLSTKRIASSRYFRSATGNFGGLPVCVDDRGIAPELHSHASAIRRLVEQAEIVQPQIVERAGDDHRRHASCPLRANLHLERAFDRLSETMIMYPPPQPLNIAPG